MDGVTYLSSILNHQYQPTNAAYYLLNGDLCQMGAMEQALKQAGFPVCRSSSGTYPGFKESDLDQFKRALKHLYTYKIEGWWNQHDKLIEYGICTEEEFTRQLDLTIEMEKIRRGE